MMKVGNGERRFALLLAARDSEYVKNVYGGYLHVFRAAFGGEGEQWDLYRVVDGEFPEMSDLHLYDGFVISGSPYDAYANDDWIVTLCHFIQVMHAMEKKVLGICFGHQVLCRAMGGKVSKSNTGWDLGLRQVNTAKHLSSGLTMGGFGFTQLPTSLAVIECHQDEVVEVPTGAHIVASSDKTGVEMFVLGRRMMGIQGHPEYTKDILFNLIDRLLSNGSIKKEMAEEAKLKMLRGGPDRKQWLKICRSFLKASEHSLDLYPVENKMEDVTQPAIAVRAGLFCH